MWNPFRRRTPAEPERVIFRWYDGERYRTGDPWELYHAFAASPAGDVNTIRASDEGDTEAQQQIALAISEVFDVKPYNPEDETGLTVVERLELCGEFISYTNEIKKKREDLPTLSEPTESGSSETPAKSRSKRVLDLSSTSQESSDAAEPPSSTPPSPPPTET